MSDSNLPPPPMTVETTLEERKALYRAKLWAHRKCETCDHYLAQEVGDTNLGVCTFNPPVPMAGMGANPQALLNQNAPPMVPMLQGVFPPTRKTNKCGKWEPKVKGSA